MRERELVIVSPAATEAVSINANKTTGARGPLRHPGGGLFLPGLGL